MPVVEFGNLNGSSICAPRLVADQDLAPRVAPPVPRLPLPVIELEDAWAQHQKAREKYRRAKAEFDKLDRPYQQIRAQRAAIKAQLDALPKLESAIARHVAAQAAKGIYDLTLSPELQAKRDEVPNLEMKLKACNGALDAGRNDHEAAKRALKLASDEWVHVYRGSCGACVENLKEQIVAIESLAQSIRFRCGAVPISQPDIDLIESHFAANQPRSRTKQ